MEYPCGECRKEVKEDDRAIQCEAVCQFWYHCDCVGIRDDEYDYLSASEDAWICPSCRNSDLPAFNSVNAIDVFHFDFQKNLPIPKLTVGQQFYCRLLWTYLFGVYSASTKLMMAFMWHELLAKRGANDVISCLSYFIFKTRLGRTGAKWSIFWADNCPGQNKNNYIMWFFSDLVRRGIYSRIDYKFLVPGHTYGPTDRHFAVIESYASNVETVYSPHQWYDIVHKAITTAASRVEVIEMKQEFFRNYRNHLRKLYTELSKDMDNKPLDFMGAVWFNFGRSEKMMNGELILIEHPEEVWVRHTYNVNEMPQCVSFMKKKKMQYTLELVPPPLYSQYPIPIKKEKAEDVKGLVSKYVPIEYQGFYTDLPLEGGSDSETE